MKPKIPFHKIHGCGNDFVVLSKKDAPADLLHSSNTISRLCDRHFGIGSDGLMIVGDASKSPIEVLMFNPDGSEMGMCGNGIRAVVRYLYLLDSSLLASSSSGKFIFSVSGREIFCETRDHGVTVEVNMGLPIFAETTKSIEVSSIVVEGQEVSLGNPHFVTFVDDMDTSLLSRLGPEIEVNNHFPNRTNVEFVRVVKRDLIDLKVWERGAGWTLACGSGACAAVIVGISQGKLDSPCLVRLPGGDLEVIWDFESKNANVFLNGPAQEVFSGTFISGY